MKSFSSNKIATAIKPRERGYILYEGPSMLDGEPIAVIATMTTSNVKTGDMVQTVKHLIRYIKALSAAYIPFLIMPSTLSISMVEKSDWEHTETLLLFHLM